MNGDFGKRVLGPALIPIGAFVFIGALVFAFSRILLAVPKDGSVVVGVLMAGCILFAAGALSKGGSLKSSQRAALVAFGVVLIGGGVAAGAGLGVREIEGHLQADVKIATASLGTNYAFDTKTLKIPANKVFGLEFVNKDPTSHNVAILRGPGGAPLFRETPFPGPATRLWKVPSIPTGVYYFQCDVHTTMNGTVLAGNATAPAGGGPPPGPAPTSPKPSPSGPPPQAAGTTIDLVAKNITFDKSSLSFTAGKPVVIEFDNQDPGLPHNFAVYTDSTLSKLIFRGDPVTGPAKTRYEFPAPAPGTYYFQCDYHPPQMKGTATVG